VVGGKIAGKISEFLGTGLLSAGQFGVAADQIAIF
jgi:hypothetical protein